MLDKILPDPLLGYKCTMTRELLLSDITKNTTLILNSSIMRLILGCDQTSYHKELLLSRIISVSYFDE